MTTHASKRFNASFWFYCFLLIHVLGFTCAPALLRDNLPLDAIEGSLWGHQLEWGYDKNPYLNGWLTALALHLDGGADWMVYLFSQLSVLLCFVCVWKLARCMMQASYALLCVLLLESIQYYQFHAIDFNDNTLELGFWAAAIYFLYRAITRRSTLAYALTGLFLGLGLMAKYYTLALIAAMGLFFLLQPEARVQLKSLKPYTALITLFLIIAPHLWWLSQHDYITVHYVFARAGNKPSWTNHLFFPLQFAWQQLEVFLPAITLILLLLIGNKPRRDNQAITLSAFDRRFLMIVGVGPFALTVLLSFISGITLRAGWGMPLLSCWTILLVAWIKPRLSNQKLYAFLACIFTLIICMLLGYRISIINSQDTSSANFPGKTIAADIETRWHQQTHTRLSYLAGSRWLGGNIAHYGNDHPAVFIEWQEARAPWINVEKLKQKGAVFLLDISAHETLPSDIRQRFPTLGAVEVLSYDWHRNRHNLPPQLIGIAILPPTHGVKLIPQPF